MGHDQHHDHQEELERHADEVELVGNTILTMRVQGFDLMIRARDAAVAHDYRLARELASFATELFDECVKTMTTSTENKIARRRAEKIAHDLTTLPF
jgi:hypothetical protein